MVFPWSLSDSKSPQVSGLFLVFLVDLNNVVVCMVSTRHLPSFPVPLPILKGLVKAPITTGITIIFMFHSFLFVFFFCSFARSRYLSIFSLSYNNTLFGLVWFSFMAYQPL